MAKRPHSIAEGLVAGALAGAFAAFVMEAFQSAAPPPTGTRNGEDAGDPSTVKAAQKFVGHDIDPADKSIAGGLVHYSFGTAIGAFYGAAASIVPFLSAGLGIPYGLAVALIADETIVPSAGLAPPARRVPPALHIYSALSHIIYGLALEAAHSTLIRINGLTRR